MLSLIIAAAVAAAPAPVPVPPGPATVKLGVDRWRAGDHAGAVSAWLPFAAQGDAAALFNLGQAYKLGRGVPRDAGVARDYYARAAAKNYLPAQTNLGIVLFQAGEKTEGMRWLRTAADRGDARAQYVFGIAAYNGDGTPKNAGMAYGYLLRAKASGLPQAATALASMEPVLTPAARSAGEAVAASLAEGKGSGAAPVAVAPAVAARGAVMRAPPVVTPPAPQIAVARPAPVPAPVAKAPALPIVRPPVQTAAAPPPPAPVVTAAPAPRPAAIVATAAPAPEVQPPRPANPVKPPAVIAAAPPKPRDWRVQLGAFGSQKQADAAWASVRATQAEAIGKAKPIFDASGAVVKVQLGPYASRDAARDVCARLAFAGRACFVTQG